MGLISRPPVLAYRCVVSPALYALFNAVMTGSTGAGEGASVEQHRIAVVAVDVVDHGGRGDPLRHAVQAALAEGMFA
jgi:hypothetical protein